MKNIILRIKSELKSIYSPQEIQAITFLIFEHVMHFSKTDFLMKSDTKLNELEQIHIMSIINRLKNNEPIQYILGKTEFYGRIFLVDKSVLIPRQETEQLVEMALQLFPQEQNISVVDLGTGSGCIAVSLAAHYAYADVLATDIAADSLAIAAKNAELNHVKITFLLDDMLNTSLNNALDLIVSNPPYIVPRQIPEMHANVVEFEPHRALFVTQDQALIFYSAIAEIARKLLKPMGFCLVEINELFGMETKELMQKISGCEARLISDIHGKDRFILMQKSI